jgi:hypothetical protein
LAVELDSEHNLKIVIPGALVGLGVLAFLAFGVHTKFIDDKVSEDGPVFERGAVGTEPVEVPEGAPADEACAGRRSCAGRRACDRCSVAFTTADLA